MRTVPHHLVFTQQRTTKSVGIKVGVHGGHSKRHRTRRIQTLFGHHLFENSKCLLADGGSDERADRGSIVSSDRRETKHVHHHQSGFLPVVLPDQDLRLQSEKTCDGTNRTEVREQHADTR